MSRPLFLTRAARFITSNKPGFSSSSTSTNTAVVEHTTIAALEASSNLTHIARHGPGDGIIKLNVGGKEFLTLRSTICSNAVLADYVARAEANGELVKDGGSAVFIDRDPTHFGIVLMFLRNRVEGVAYNTKFNKLTGAKKLSPAPKYVRLPNDKPDVLQDLYVEATHYRIQPLMKQLCEASLLTMIFNRFGQGGNPFDQAGSFFKYLKRASALTLVGTGGTVMATLQQDLDWLTGERFRIKLPGVEEDEKKKKKEKDVDKASEVSLA
jgi:hypothetical protein